MADVKTPETIDAKRGIVAKPDAPRPIVAADKPQDPAPVAKPQPVSKPVVAKRASAPSKKAAPVKAAAAPKEKTMDIKNTAETITAKAQTMFADANDRTKGAMAKGQQLLDDVNSFNKGNIEAIVESSKIAAKGFEAMGQDAAAYAKKSFEEATAAAKTLATVKSPTEFVRLQSDYARTAFDNMVAHSSRSTEMMLKLAGEVAQPISNRVALAAEKVKIAA